MLAPDARTLFSAALVAPDGFDFDRAIGTSYGVDLSALLEVPLHLALRGGHDLEGLFADPVTLLESLERAANRLVVFGQRGRLVLSGKPNPLFALLESTIAEAHSPLGGSFHPKVWALRFVSGDDVRYRLLVLSRNLTRARTWDIALQLDGRVTDELHHANAPLARFVRTLPACATMRSPEHEELCEATARELSRVAWELPDGFHTLRFRDFGGQLGAMPPLDGERFGVITPFLSLEALRHLSATGARPVHLLSRSDELSEAPAEVAPLFDHVWEFDDSAQSFDTGEEDEESAELRHGLFGLHAKVFAVEKGDDLHLLLGSANATSAALLRGHNVEFMAELVGRRDEVGGLDDLFGEKGLGPLLQPHRRPDTPHVEDSDEVRSRAALEAARKALAAAAMRVDCRRIDGDEWRLVLACDSPISHDDLDDLEGLTAWPVTLAEGHQATDASALLRGDEVELPPCALSSLTGLIAFRATDAILGRSIRIVRNIPVEGLPEERDAAVMARVVADGGGFMRYVRLLLQGPSEIEPVAIAEMASALSTGGGTEGGGWSMEAPLLENLVRTYSRHPARLDRLRRRVDLLRKAPNASEIIPADFLATWRVFEDALDGDAQERS